MNARCWHGQVGRTMWLLTEESLMVVAVVVASSMLLTVSS